tara:strand:+ start:434 stop:1333 length:900 start_codon:yes stop_codon:yes gene_type:complete
MGNTDSSAINTDQSIYNTNEYYSTRYNLIPSFGNNAYETINSSFFGNANKQELPSYVDLRKDFVDIINVGSLGLNPIACVSYLLQYSLLKNELPVFPPSLMFIYKNCKFYKSHTELLTFETIFKAIRTNGLCIENEFRTNEHNFLDGKISASLYEKSQPYKYIKVFNVERNLNNIKHILYNKYPILVGLSVYYNFARITNNLWLPNHETEKNIGGIGGVIVGYIEERKLFIMAQTYGSSFGQNGYIMVPYDYILNKNFTFDMYVLDLDKDRIDGYLNQTQPILSIKEEETKGFFSNLFS